MGEAGGGGGPFMESKVVFQQGFLTCLDLAQTIEISVFGLFPVLPKGAQGF